MVHVVNAMQPLQKNSGGEVDLALFRPAYSDNTVITLDHRASFTVPALYLLFCDLFNTMKTVKYRIELGDYLDTESGTQ